MTTEQRATTCGLAEGGSVGVGVGVGVGCRGVGVGRAEAFARSLHHKLRSLGGVASGSVLGVGASPARPDSPDDMDDSWSSGRSVPSVPSGHSEALRTLSTSSVDSSSELFYDLDFSPQSPQEEVTSQELAGMMAGSCNWDDLHTVGPQSPQSDCGSDYFDTDAYDDNRDREPPPGPPPGTHVSPESHNGDAPANGVGLTNGDTTHVNGHGSVPKAKRPWGRVPHKYKAGTPEAMSEVSALTLDDADDDEDEGEGEGEERSRSRTNKQGLAKLNFAKSSQTLMQEGLIEQLKQGHDIPVELKNGLCPCDDPPAPCSRGLAAMKEMARTLSALETPDTPTPAAELAEDVAQLRLGSEDAQGDATATGSTDVPRCKCEHRDLPADCPECKAINVNGECADESGLNGHTEHADEEDEEEKRPRIRRCSSLKTGKTPPGTPGRKKIVRFADVLGLDLADVRTFLDEIPKVPTSAYSDLQDVDPLEALAAAGAEGCLPSGLPQLALAFHAPTVVVPSFGVRAHVTRVLVPLFQQPGGMVDFIERIRARAVCLENAVVADAALLSIAGQVRVRNLDFHKTVHIRYSTDGWRSFADLQATYVPNSCDGFSDKFTFTLFAGHTMLVGQRLELAVRFQCKGQQYWDNNNGVNYCFQCLPPSGAPPSLQALPVLSSPCSDDGWKMFF